jgi:carbon monoxide dehydrogenase subunit G
VTTFTTRNASVEAVAAPIEDVWDAMVDPDLLADLTPLIDRIEVQGDHWRWCLSSIKALGVEVAPCFTVAMTFEEPTLIAFEHDPPPGTMERAGATGSYDLSAFDGGTVLDIDMEMAVDLPLPRMSRGAVERVMGRTTQLAGDRFFENLLSHLGTRRVPVPDTTTEAA